MIRLALTGPLLWTAGPLLLGFALVERRRRTMVRARAAAERQLVEAVDQLMSCN